jgi:hypothetical protein
MCDDDDDDEVYDDRMDRWMEVNGITRMGWRVLDDGSVRMLYVRADGSEVTPENQYPYDALLTPYTRAVGRA